MKVLWLVVVLSAAGVRAQPAFDPAEFDRVREEASKLRQGLAPAAVDPHPIDVLFRRLSRDGVLEESEGRRVWMYKRLGSRDGDGRVSSLQVGLVEYPGRDGASGGLAEGRPFFSRVFGRLEAKSESWRRREDGRSQIDVWDWVVSLDGRLLSVTHVILPVEVGPDGPESVGADGRLYRMSPGDPSVQRRWKRLVRDLLTMGRTVEI